MLHLHLIPQRELRTSSDGEWSRKQMQPLYEHVMQTGIGRHFIQQWLVGLTVAATLVCTAAHSQNKGAQFSTVAELRALAADPKTVFDTVQVSRFLGKLPAAEPQAVDHQLIAMPHEELIAGVLLRVLRNRDEGAVGLISSRITGWKTDTRARAMEIPAIARGPFLAIPRALLRDAVGGAKVYGSAILGYRPVG